MLIEQIIEFKLRGPGYSARTYSYNWIFLWKSKNLVRKIFKCIIIYCKNVARGNVPTWAKWLTKFNPKCKILNVFYA